MSDYDLYGEKAKADIVKFEECDWCREYKTVIAFGSKLNPDELYSLLLCGDCMQKLQTELKGGPTK
jgi:hypothetical protein